VSRQRTMESPYMHWAKTHQAARYPLAISGIKQLTLAELGATIDDVELGGPNGYGSRELREALATKAGVVADRIVLATGTSGANHLLFATLLGPGDEIALEHPVYEPIEMLARHLGSGVRHFARRRENGFRIDPDDVAAAVTSRTRLVVLSNHHNPTAVVTDGPTLRAIGGIADKVGATTVVDEAYLDAAFDRGASSAVHLGDGFAVTSSLTKVFGLSGLRCGWIVAEPKLAGRIWQLKNLFGVDEVHPGSRLAIFALGKSAELLARARRILDENRAGWSAFLGGRDDLEPVPAPSGNISFPRVTSCDADELCAHLRARYETSVVPGRFFGAPEHVRIGLCGDPATFAAGLERLGRALDDLKRRG